MHYNKALCMIQSNH